MNQYDIMLPYILITNIMMTLYNKNKCINIIWNLNYNSNYCQGYLKTNQHLIASDQSDVV